MNKPQHRKAKDMKDPRPSDNRAAERYVKRIKNPNKRQYAAAYLGYRLGLLEHMPATIQISYMAAQAVRMRLDCILG